MKTLRLSNDFKGATIRFLLFAVAMIFLANLAYANHSTPTLSVKFAPIAKNVIIELNNVQSTGINISIRDNAGVTLHNEDFSAVGYFIKKFNFKNLPDGAYNIVVKDEAAILTQAITIYNNRIETGNLYQVYAPVFNYHTAEKSMAINWTVNSNYSFNIYDENGEAIYNENNVSKGAMKKTYKLEALPIGKYKAILTTTWESYEKEFSIQ